MKRIVQPVKTVKKVAEPDSTEAVLLGELLAVTRSGELRTGDPSSVYGISEHVSRPQNNMAPPTGSIHEPDLGKLSLRLRAIGEVA